MGKFNLNGKTVEKDGKFGCEITLDTPDGKVTKLESGFVYESDVDAAAGLKLNMDRIIEEFTSNHEVNVVSRTEGVLQ